jgi:hypothetical protein
VAESGQVNFVRLWAKVNFVEFSGLLGLALLSNLVVFPLFSNEGTLETPARGIYRGILKFDKQIVSNHKHIRFWPRHNQE